MFEMNEDQSKLFRGMSIGDELAGSSVGVKGKIRITGGSDHSGFPMRSDVLGGSKKYVLLTKGVGFRSTRKGLKRRKMVRGKMITDEIYQINSVIIEEAPNKKNKPEKMNSKEKVVDDLLVENKKDNEIKAESENLVTNPTNNLKADLSSSEESKDTSV
jgi:small subunit ribosomal protein S6e